MEEERWLRVEDWLLNHLADVQDRAFIIMPRDLAAYEEMMRRCGSGFSGSVMVPAASECVFTDAAMVDSDAVKVDLDAAKVDLDAAKVNSDAAKVDLDSVRVRQKRGLSPNHLDGNDISCPSNAWENHRKGAGVRRRAAATPQRPGHPFRSRPRLPAPFFLKCRRANSQPGRRAAAAPWGRCRSQRFSGRAG
jgi:hypothetical protein